jgi:hypothetical protein
MNWISALKQFNANSNTWCVPKKGTPEYKKVRDIMAGKKPEETEYYTKTQIFPVLNALIKDDKVSKKLDSLKYHSDKMDYLTELDKRIPMDPAKFYKIPAKNFFLHGLY